VAEHYSLPRSKILVKEEIVEVAPEPRMVYDFSTIRSNLMHPEREIVHTVTPIKKEVPQWQRLRQYRNAIIGKMHRKIPAL